MSLLLGAVSIIGLISAQGLLPGGLEMGQSREAAAAILPGAASGAPLVGAFSLEKDLSLVQHPFRLTIYGRNNVVTNISLNNQKDESGELYSLLSDRLADGLGAPDGSSKGENIESKTWKRDGLMVSLRRVLGKVTEVSISDSATSIFAVQ